MAMEKSQKIILEGFQNAKIGYELDLSKWQIKFLFAAEMLSENYIALSGKLHCGRIIKICDDLEIINSLALESQFAKRDFKTEYESISIKLTPSINSTLYKQFKRFIIGGGVGLDLWQVQKGKSGNNNSGWYLKRQFVMDPHFIIGFKIK
jgi:hypothetical protein